MKYRSHAGPRPGYVAY